MEVRVLSPVPTKSTQSSLDTISDELFCLFFYNSVHACAGKLLIHPSVVNKKLDLVVPRMINVRGYVNEIEAFLRKLHFEAISKHDTKQRLTK
ncbi:hypothetical protein BSK66_30670 [Paenibacillus odorifer]|uniref:Uncharacterized protein n=1 Tax=Paenibacillus odorifer TaxID=189426 RepID=A0A1R0WWN2_9BACL|nr:hypothetical protein C171_27225 [Paenibacillus sp. FSL H8-237]OMD16483.1 hypothetical protein BJP50_17970 [Paenibacillus odorifer]OMD23019.1 hypothetical protein BJP51_30885 [Paenibacillus odorifer]OME14734.1 hypothetical protein BSK57_28545 [Paenibacillus odorifer]OME25209.1 hypothetical protein BSK63_29425 [Paenibacillus odorifer]